MASRAAQARRDVVEGDDSIAITPPARWRAAAIETYDDHRMAMAMSLAAFNGAAGAAPAMPVRILDPRCVAKTLPDYFEALFGVAAAVRGDDPGAHDRRPDRLRQGHAGERGRRRARLRAARLRRRLPRDRASRRCRPASTPTTKRRSSALALAPWTCASTAGRTFLAGADVSDSLRLEEVGALASRISAWPRVRAALLGAADSRSAACPAWSPTAATWARSSSPTRRSRSSSPRAPPNAPSGGTSS